MHSSRDRGARTYHIGHPIGFMAPRSVLYGLGIRILIGESSANAAPASCPKRAVRQCMGIEGI